MPSRAFAQVDVFTLVPGFGNPVAVVLDATGLTGADMQRFANWTNLSETTFVLPATGDGAHYRVRIFTPDEELPFAGHPTIGTARALADAGRLPDQDTWVQECAAGLVTLRATAEGVVSFAAPPAQVSAAPVSAEQIGAVLGGPAPRDVQLIEIGPRWVTGRMDLEALDTLAPDGTAAVRAMIGSTGFNLYAVDDGQHVHVRSFFAAGGMLTEDPVCGSGNAAVAVHLGAHAGDIPLSYQARQGKHRGRDGRISVTRGDQIWVGGPAVTVVSGSVVI